MSFVMIIKMINTQMIVGLLKAIGILLVTTVKCSPVPVLDNNSARWLHLSGGGYYKPGTDGPGARTNSASWADLAGNLWLFGGLGEDTINQAQAHLTNDLWFYNNTDMKWKEVKKPSLKEHKSDWSHLTPPLRKGAVGCGVPGVVFVIFGGEGINQKAFDDTWVYSMEKQQWLLLYHPEIQNVTHPQGRVSPVMWCLQDKMVIFGGLKEKNSGMWNDMWVFSLRDLTWSVLPFPQPSQMFPGPRSGSTTWAGLGSHTLYLFGGVQQNISKSIITGDLWKYSLITQTWTSIPESPGPPARKYAQGWRMKGVDKLVLFGGEGYDMELSHTRKPIVFDDMWVYDISPNLWKNMPFYVASVEKSGRNVSYTPAQTRSVCWSSKENIFYTFGGLGYASSLDKANPSLQNNFWMLIPPNTEIPKVIDLKSLQLVLSPKSDQALASLYSSPGFIFLMSFITFGGVVMLVGAMFCLKKMADYPRHNPGREYKVRYAKLAKNDDNLEDESREFLIHNDDNENKTTFRVKK